MKVIDTIDRAFAKVEETLAVALLTAMVAVISLQILNQTLLHIHAIVWTEEVSRILFVWSIMIGSSLAVRKGDHLAVDFIYNNLKGIVRFICRVIVLLICIFTCLYIFRSGIYLVAGHIQRGDALGVTLLPTWVISSAVPVGFCLMTVRFVLLFIKEIAGRFGKGLSAQEKGGNEPC